MFRCHTLTHGTDLRKLPNMQGLTPAIPRTVTHHKMDGHSLSLRMVTNHDTHPPSLWWSSSILIIVPHHPQDGQTPSLSWAPTIKRHLAWLYMDYSLWHEIESPFGHYFKPHGVLLMFLFFSVVKWSALGFTTRLNSIAIWSTSYGCFIGAYRVLYMA